MGMTEAAPPVPQAEARFFGARDKTAFLLATVLAFVVYVWTVAPSVTLEYSGELLTAAHTLGVPHPPGYPTWTMLAWLWQRIIPVGNIAWRVNLMSAVFGALAAGLTALLISKSGRVLASQCGFLRRVPERLLELIVLASSVSAALMLAFSPLMWSQSTITEVYALDAFFLTVILALLYRWSHDTEHRWRLYLAAFLWGVSLTNHQTLVLLTLAFPTFVWLTDRKLGRDVLAPILAVILLAALRMIMTPGSLFHQGTFSAAWILAHGIGAGVWLYALWKEGPGFMGMWRPTLAVYAAVLLGLTLYAYEPLASATNPPINWGYARTPAGFVHHVMTGQYEKVHSERTPLQFWGQINMFFDDLKSQFTIGYALIALLAMFFYRDLDRKDRDWLTFLLVAFLFLALDYIFFSNPTFEKQKQFTDRVSFLPCHCVYSLWIGYGLILGCGYLLSEKPALQSAALPMVAVIFALPIAPLFINWADNEERGHDFGYQFGYLIFKPGGGYPDMDKGAILFGGTDEGRFVPTYMVYVESQVPPRIKTTMAKYPGSDIFDRRDVYVITQNALAEGTYMKSIRDHYGLDRPEPQRPETLKDRSGWQRALFHFAWWHWGRDEAFPRDPIWVPAESDQQSAIRQYIDELRIRQPLPGEDVRIENGRVNLRGVTSVMTVNGYVAKAIFDHNKDAHSFYVEESYSIPWMYPYLEPYGIIFKIDKNPLPRLTPDMVARDRAYWDALFDELRADPRFRRDDVAQKTFSKLRSSIGGLYAFHHMTTDAEYAFQQAISLCPDSPEGNFRLAQLYIESGRFDDAAAVLAEYQKHDRYNARIPEAIKTIQKLKLQSGEERELEQQYAAEPGNIQIAQQLLDAYALHRRVDAMDSIVTTLLSHTDLPAEAFPQIAQRYIRVGRLDRAAELLTSMAERYPQNREAWYNLAVVESAERNCEETAVALERALSLDDAEHHALEAIGRDPRFVNCHQDPRFQHLLTAPSHHLPPSPPLHGDVTITH